MKLTSTRIGKPGFLPYVLVLSTGIMLMVFTLLVYRRAMAANATQAQIQLRMDYGEKEDAIARAIVAITPNRAIRAMQSNSNSDTSISNPLRWRNIFSEALTVANAQASIDSNVLSSLRLNGAVAGNSGDSALGSPSRIFHLISGVNDDQDTSFASAGINRSLGSGFPVPLTTANATTIALDPVYPIISRDKKYDTLAQGGVALPVADYPNFNLLTYPNINFGYTKPGELFVAKRNWWAFTMDLAAHDEQLTKLARRSRDFVLSIYEIPSQLPISSSAYMSLGNYASGEAWRNFAIEGSVFAGKAEVTGQTTLSALASRRGMSLASDATIGGQSFGNNPFTPGQRESYQVTQGEFFPVSLASESGRVAFIPINRGVDFFDRFANSTESNTLSPTTWNNYSVGALQCAMRLDITQCVSATNKSPTKLRFSYLRNGVRQPPKDIFVGGNSVAPGLPSGAIFACNENQSYDFGTAVVDAYYGKNGVWAYKPGVTGVISFNNATFGDPVLGAVKAGYFVASSPFSTTTFKTLSSGQICLEIYPERIAKYLTAIGADDTSVNNSLVVNVDYSTTTGSVFLSKPSIPCTDLDYGVIVQECKDLTSYTKGFSLVTNLRTYFGDHFNEVPTTPPVGYTPTHAYYPPVSVFCPEKRFGLDFAPPSVQQRGQIGSLASDTGNAVRPLDGKTMTGSSLSASRLSTNLWQIRHPAEVPPITMMNWLVVLEERNGNFVGY